MTTISTSTTLGVSLYPDSDKNPIVINPGVTISNGVYAAAGNGSWTIQNSGKIEGAGSAFGVVLNSGGSVTNAASGSIVSGNGGQPDGILITGGVGNVVNAGSIIATHYGGYNGVIMRRGGSVTNAASASIQGGNDGVVIFGGVATVVNSGTIFGDSFSIYLSAGGSVTNAASGSITGGGIHIGGLPGTVVNYGSIAGNIINPTAIVATSVTNAVSASITGSVAANETVLNQGSINGNIEAKSVTNDVSASIMGNVDATSVTNAAFASIMGGVYGVDLPSGGTLTNAGTITGTSGPAVAFGGTGSNLLVLRPGYGFLGLVTGSAGASNTLELASAASAGVLAHLGKEFVSFGSTVFDAGSNWSITGTKPSVAGTVTMFGSVQEDATSFANAGSVIVNAGTLDVNTGTFDNTAGTVTVENGGTFFIASTAVLDGGSVTMSEGSVTTVLGSSSSGFDFGDPATLIFGYPSAFTGTISGFGFGDAIELMGQTISSGGISGTTLTLNLAGGGTQMFNVAPGETGLKFAPTPTGGLAVACFAAGTRILTASGEVVVEALAPGDMLATLSGRLRPVRWIGRRYIACRNHPQPEKTLPVRVLAGAFGVGKPHRDLYLSPDHAVFVEGNGEGAAPDVLIPIGLLVNGTTIAQVPAAEVTYYHLELASHEVVLAEGLPAETYLETGNRDCFDDFSSVRLHPVFGDVAWEALGYAPLVVTGAKLDRVREQLRRIEQQTPCRELSHRRQLTARG
jgi:hypothetical protein